MGQSPGGRVLTVVGALVLVGLTLRLIVGVLRPVLPAQLMQGLGSGWQLLYGIVAPSVPYAAAIGMVWLVVWVLTGRWRRR